MGNINPLFIISFTLINKKNINKHNIIIYYLEITFKLYKNNKNICFILNNQPSNIYCV